MVDGSARLDGGVTAIPGGLDTTLQEIQQRGQQGYAIEMDLLDRGSVLAAADAIASTTFDLPLPFGPTTTVTPGSKSNTVVSAKDLKPLMVSDFKNTNQTSHY